MSWWALEPELSTPETGTQQMKPVQDHTEASTETSRHDVGGSGVSTALCAECRFASSMAELPQTGCHPFFSTRSACTRSSPASSLADLSRGVPDTVSDGPEARGEGSSRPCAAAMVEETDHSAPRTPGLATSRPGSSGAALVPTGMFLCSRQSEAGSQSRSPGTSSPAGRGPTSRLEPHISSTTVGSASAVPTDSFPKGRTEHTVTRGHAGAPQAGAVERIRVTQGMPCSWQLELRTSDPAGASHEIGTFAKVPTEERTQLQQVSKGEGRPTTCGPVTTWLRTSGGSDVGPTVVTRSTLPTVTNQMSLRGPTGKEPTRSTVDRCSRSTAECGTRRADEKGVQLGGVAPLGPKIKTAKLAEGQRATGHDDQATTAGVGFIVNQEGRKDNPQDLRRASETSSLSHAYNALLQKDSKVTGAPLAERWGLFQQLGEVQYLSLAQEQHVPPQGLPAVQLFHQHRGQPQSNLQMRSGGTTQTDENILASHSTRIKGQTLQQQHTQQLRLAEQGNGQQYLVNGKGQSAPPPVQRSHQDNKQPVQELQQQLHKRAQHVAQDQYQSQQHTQKNVPRQTYGGHTPAQSGKPQHEILQGCRPLSQVGRPCVQPSVQFQLSHELPPQPRANATTGQQLAAVKGQGHLQLETSATTRLIHPDAQQARLSRAGLWSPQHQNDASMLALQNAAHPHALWPNQPRVQHVGQNFLDQKAVRALHEAGGQMAVPANWQRRGSLPVEKSVTKSPDPMVAAEGSPSPQAQHTRLPDAGSQLQHAMHPRVTQPHQSEARGDPRTGRACESGAAARSEHVAAQTVPRTHQQAPPSTSGFSHQCRKAQQPQEPQQETAQAGTQQLYSTEGSGGRHRESPPVWHLNLERQARPHVPAQQRTQLPQHYQPLYYQPHLHPTQPAAQSSGQMLRARNSWVPGFPSYSPLLHPNAAIPATQASAALPCQSSQYGSYASGVALGLRQTAPSLIQMKPTI